jgi:hypothetical protein
LTISFSQSPKKDAERLFDNLFPVGLTIGYHFNSFENTSTQGYSYERKQNSSYSIGLDYNFLQTGRFNFSFGAYYKQINSTGDLLIPAQVGSNSSNQVFSYDRNLGFISLNLKTEFVKNISANHFLSFSLAIQGNFMNDDSLAGTRNGFSESDDPDTAVAGLIFYPTFGFEIFTPISLSYYNKTENSGLFRIDVSHSFKNSYIFGDEVRNFDLNEGEGTKSYHQWRGGYTAVSFSWFPKWIKNAN